MPIQSFNVSFIHCILTWFGHNMNLQIKTHQVVSKANVSIEDNVGLRVFKLAPLFLT